MPVKSATDVDSWDEWFRNCSGCVEDLQKYEQLMQAYYNLQFSKTPAGQEGMNRAMWSQHKLAFYNANALIPKWRVQRAVIYGLLGMCGGFLGWLIFLIIQHGVEAVSAGFGWVQNSLIVAVISGLVVIAGYVGGHALRINRLKAKMGAMEKLLEPRVRSIPPKYRNCQATSVFYELYCSQMALTFNQAMTMCDEYLHGNDMIGAYMAVLFDAPYERTDMQTVGGNGSRNLYEVGESTEPKDPSLPDDIASKTYSGADDADAQLHDMVGLANVKQQVQQLKNRVKFYDRGKQDRITGNHMVFLGPPGTGKTTIARIITKVLHDFGYIHDNKCVEIDGGYLKSPYVGQTTERVGAIVRYAMGGVLFIDEAYTLLDEGNGVGAEAVGVLLKAMEDHKDELVVIMAGYEDNINRLLASNEGFSSRIKYKIYFEDFAVDEMMEIFKRLMGSSQQYYIEDAAMELISAQFARERRMPGFGNARVVRNAWDGILDAHADRFMQGQSTDKFLITTGDAESYIEDRKHQMQIDGRNFIASQNLDSTVVSLQELKGRTKEGSADPDGDLGKLTGLQMVRREIAQMQAQFDFYDGKMESDGCHMVFLGPPGTGKTTVASIMTGYLYKMGIISTNSYLDVNGDFLRGMYLGHTGKRTEAVVQYAQGMVLFVDEAYLLNSAEGDNFGKEAIGVLLDAMEKYRKNFVVIFAGYEHEMDAFLSMNSGLRSRINLEFHFASYTPHELAEMFRSIAKAKQFKVEKEVWIPLQKYLQSQVSDPHFGNGRFIRQFFALCQKQHIANYANGLHNEDKKYTITLTDVEPFLGLISDE